MIARGVDFKDGDDKGITPLNCAVHYGRLENVEVILKIAKEKEAEAPEQEEKPEAMEVGEGGSDEEEGSDDEKPKKVAIKKADSELGVSGSLNVKSYSNELLRSLLFKAILSNKW